MPISILMPALSPTMEEGTLARWLVGEGDSVSAGDVIAEIETDKATMEVESIDDGVVGKLLVEAGSEGVAVNTLIALLLEEGEDVGALEDISATKANVKSESHSISTTEQEPQSSTGTPAAPTSATIANMSADANGRRVFASPLARRIAKQNDIDLSTIEGGGPHGRIIKRDVEAVISSGGSSPVSAPASAAAMPAASASAGSVGKLFADDSYRLEPHDGMRKTIAKRLTEAKQTVPHFYLTLDCRIDELLALRAKINDAASKDADGKPNYKISVNDMVIKAHALALRDIPAANASWSDEGMLLHNNVDIGVAVAIPGGLITPIIRRAEEKTLSAIANEMKDLAGRARVRKLMPDEYQGGSTAISNLGMFGIKEFAAVINPPHATILAVGAGRQEPVVTDGAVAIATVMNVTLSTDHRAVDGALGAELLSKFKHYIENPMGMLV